MLVVVRRKKIPSQTHIIKVSVMTHGNAFTLSLLKILMQNRSIHIEIEVERSIHWLYRLSCTGSQGVWDNPCWRWMGGVILTHRDRQPFMVTGNLVSPVNLLCMSLTKPYEKTQTAQGEHANKTSSCHQKTFIIMFNFPFKLPFCGASFKVMTTDAIAIFSANGQ